MQWSGIRAAVKGQIYGDLVIEVIYPKDASQLVEQLQQRSGPSREVSAKPNGRFPDALLCAPSVTTTSFDAALLDQSILPSLKPYVLFYCVTDAEIIVTDVHHAARRA